MACRSYLTAFHCAASLRAAVNDAGSFTASAEITTTAFRNSIRRISSCVGLAIAFSRATRVLSACTDGLLVADGSQLGVAHHLRLESFRQDVVQVVVHQVPRDGRNAFLRLQDVSRRTVLLLDRCKFLVRSVLEKVFKPRIKSVLVVERGVRGPPLVEDLEGRAVPNGVHELVRVNVLAETLHGALCTVLLRDQGRARKSYPR